MMLVFKCICLFVFFSWLSELLHLLKSSFLGRLQCQNEQDGLSEWIPELRQRWADLYCTKHQEDCLLQGVRNRRKELSDHQGSLSILPNFAFSVVFLFYWRLLWWKQLQFWIVPESQLRGVWSMHEPTSVHFHSYVPILTIPQSGSGQRSMIMIDNQSQFLSFFLMEIHCQTNLSEYKLFRPSR